MKGSVRGGGSAHGGGEGKGVGWWGVASGEGITDGGEVAKMVEGGAGSPDTIATTAVVTMTTVVVGGGETGAGFLREYSDPQQTWTHSKPGPSLDRSLTHPMSKAKAKLTDANIEDEDDKYDNWEGIPHVDLKPSASTSATTASPAVEAPGSAPTTNAATPLVNHTSLPAPPTVTANVPPPTPPTVLPLAPTTLETPAQPPAPIILKFWEWISWHPTRQGNNVASGVARELWTSCGDDTG
ncbi:hypothetical protein OF83DRAFT_1088026 [Amylostereum chailletii]|nr:hypothetical protein OF83DRAFT_1088026 [Amylostereum chailletii]